MNNNKNNTANTAEESNKKIMIYGGIAIALLIVGFGLWYIFGGAGKKEGDSSSATEEVKKLIESGFVSEKCGKAIKAYEANKTDENKQKLKDILTEDGADSIKKEYEKNKEASDKLKNEMKSMVSSNEIACLENSLKKLEVSSLEGDKSKKVKENINNASKELEKAQKAKNNAERRTALTAAKTALYECVKDISCPTTNPDYLIPEANAAFKPVQDNVKEIGKILGYTPESGETVKYNEDSLQKGLNEWKKKYQEISDKHAAANALGLFST